VRHCHCGGVSWSLAPHGRRNCLLASITDRRTQIAHRTSKLPTQRVSRVPLSQLLCLPIEQPAILACLYPFHSTRNQNLVVTWSPNHVRTIGSTARRAYLAPGWFRESKFEKDHRSSISCPTRTFDTLSICISVSSPAYSYVTSVGDLLISTAVNVRLCDDGAKSE